MSVAVDLPIRRPAARPAARPAGRLTARGRVAILVGCLFAVVTAPPLVRATTGLVDSVFGSSSGISGPPAAGSPPPVRTVVVRPSDTLWRIAARVAPAEDPRMTVAALERANRIRDDRLTPGQLLVVPGG